MRLRAAKLRPLVPLGLGAAVLAAGLLMAHRWLPEWRLHRLPPREAFVARYHALASRLGMHLAPGEPRTTLTTTRRLDGIICTDMDQALAAACSEVRVTVGQMGKLAEEPLPREFEIGLSLSVEEQSVVWAVPAAAFFTATVPVRQAPMEPFAACLLRSGEALGPPRQLLLGGSNVVVYPLAGPAPPHHPKLPGWDLAALSILATEAGGDLYDFLVDDDGKLWSAAGDIAGHGYSCAIVQAMTTAALTSLISPEKTPSEVLRRVDRVIRRGAPGKTSRNFTTLALLRLDPESGEVLLSNAGHPFPFLVIPQAPGQAGEVTEIELPGLPLGQGPARNYRDHASRSSRLIS